MLHHYLKVALRYLLRYKQYTAINILGLAVGITCCILIMLFVRSEFSYDKFHSKSDRIYRVWQHEKIRRRGFYQYGDTPANGWCFAIIIWRSRGYLQSICFFADGNDWAEFVHGAGENGGLDFLQDV